MEAQMTQSLQELLAQVRSAEAEPVEWAKVQARVVGAMASPKSVVTYGGNDTVALANAAQRAVTHHTVSAHHGSLTTWLGGGVAAGVVVAGLLLTSQQHAALSECETCVNVEPALSPHPIVLDALIPEFGAETWSPRVQSRKSRKAPVAAGQRTEVAIAPAPASTEPASLGPEVRQLGESDVEYDRRHLAPIDAALQAHQPGQALQLLSAFKPRKLTNYARALRAIALCGAGQAAEGKRLGAQTLPQITNRGLARRVQTACKVSPTNEE
jgi:hypothetical protein